MWGNIVFFTHRERDISPASVSVDFSCLHILKKGPLQTRSSQGCHLLANMLSVIFCAQGSPSRAGPHGSLTHANRTNPSRTCLSVSLSPSLPCLLIPPALSLSLFPFLQCFSLSCLFALASISLFVHLFLLLSLSVPEDGAGAVCQLTVAVPLCLCVSLHAHWQPPPYWSKFFCQRWQAAVGSAAEFSVADWTPGP